MLPTAEYESKEEEVKHVTLKEIIQEQNILDQDLQADLPTHRW